MSIFRIFPCAWETRGGSFSQDPISVLKSSPPTCCACAVCVVSLCYFCLKLDFMWVYTILARDLLLGWQNHTVFMAMHALAEGRDGECLKHLPPSVCHPEKAGGNQIRICCFSLSCFRVRKTKGNRWKENELNLWREWAKSRLTHSWPGL